MRMLAAAVVTAAIVVVTGVTAVPAQAQPSPDVTSTSLTSPYAEAGTGASVIASMKQWEYADISYNVSFEGFTALGTFPFGRGSCPASLVTVSATAKVFKCGWVQRGSSATLRLALRGTFDRSRISVTLADGAMTAPHRPGVYAVTVSGWSFDDVVGSVRVCPAQGGSRGDVAAC